MKNKKNKAAEESKKQHFPLKLKCDYGEIKK